MNTRKSSPSIRISCKKNRAVHISKSTLKCLDNPPYIRLLYVEGKNLLMVSASDTQVNGAIAIPEKSYIETHNEFRIFRKILTEAFRVRLGWAEGESYRVNGTYSPKLKMVVFELENALKLGAESNL